MSQENSHTGANTVTPNLGSDQAAEPATAHVSDSTNAPPADTAPALQDQTAYLPVRHIISVFVACAAVGIAGMLDETTISVALPVISSEFHAGSQISWAVNAYFVTSTACQMLYGRLSDIWSRKTVLLTLMSVFFLGNLASALSRTFVQLLVFRAFVGIGGGGMPTIGQVIVSDVVSLRERGKYQGILGAAVALSYGVGPIIGGAFVASGQWRWVFWLNLPTTAVAAICVMLFMPLRAVEGNALEKLRKVDFFGAGFILAGTTLFIISLTWAGGEFAWSNAHVIATLVVGLVAFFAFLLWEWKGPKFPLMPLYIYKNKVVVGAVVTQTINGFLTVVQVFLLPTFYQLAFGYSPVKSGAMVLPITLVQTVTSTASGAYISWTGRYRELILTGWALWAIGLGLFSTMNHDTSLAKQVGYSMLTGFGVGQTFQPSLVALQGAVERHEMAVVTSLRSFVRNLGGTLGLAISGTIVDNVLRSRLKSLDLSSDEYDAIVQSPYQARFSQSGEALDTIVAGYHAGFRTVFFMLSGLATLGFLVAFFLMTNLDLHRSDDEKLKKEGKELLGKLKDKKTGMYALSSLGKSKNKGEGIRKEEEDKELENV